MFIDSCTKESERFRPSNTPINKRLRLDHPYKNDQNDTDIKKRSNDIKECDTLSEEIVDDVLSLKESINDPNSKRERTFYEISKSAQKDGDSLLTSIKCLI